MTRQEAVFVHYADFSLSTQLAAVAVINTSSQCSSNNLYSKAKENNFWTHHSSAAFFKI